MTRVLVVTLDFPPTSGGIQTMLREFVARSECEVRVVAPADPGWEVCDAQLRVPVVRVRGFGSRRRGYAVPVARAALREARRWRPDVVLFSNVAAALAGPVLARRGVPYAVLAHGAELRGNRQRLIAGPVLKRAARVLANSRFTRDLVTSLGADPARTVVVNPGAPEPRLVDPARVAALRVRLGLTGRVLLTVARLVPHKGIDLVLRALREIPKDVSYLIAGEGPERAALESLAGDLGVAARVRFAGRLSDDDLAAAYAAADAFVLTSRDLGDGGVEGFGIAILEAGSFGVPAIASGSGGIPDALLDGETGLLVDPDDIAGLTRVLHALLSDPARAQSMGNRARDLAASSRSWTAFVRRIDECSTQVSGAAREGTR